MTEKEEFEMRDEYDFTNARPNPYAAAARGLTNLVFIEPDLFELFPSSETVNDALRHLVEERGKPQSDSISALDKAS